MAEATIRKFSVNAIPLTDRCDRCGAQAFAKAKLPSAQHSLLFCAHHYGDAELKLVGIPGIVIDDYRGALDAEVEEARSKLGI